MNEQEWLTSDDPQAMLTWLRVSAFDARWKNHPGSKWMDRKLRLFACEDDRSREAVEIAPLTTQSDLLREIVGNPFRLVALPLVAVVDKVTQAGVLSCPWLTPTVLDLAQHAYDERPKWKCVRCKGTGIIREDHDPHKGWLYDQCPDCHGTGCIDDSTLDAGTMLALSDALEEAGCTDKALLMHLRGRELVLGQTVATGNLCPKCGARGPWRSGVHFDHKKLCHECGITWEPGIDYTFSSRWCPIRGQHVRGCWAVDTILGI